MKQHKACEAVLKIINFERQTCDRQTETCQLTERGRIYNGLNCTVDDDQEKLGKFWFAFDFAPRASVCSIHYLFSAPDPVPT